MLRATSVCRADAVDRSQSIDRVLLDADERQRRRVVLTGEKGMRFLLDLPRVMGLRDGDGLVLDDGRMVRVVARRELLIEISVTDATALARIAWHLGNRHTEVEIIGERLRIRRDHVLEEMLHGLGARLEPVEAPFEPERGAYAHEHKFGQGGGAEFHV
jgi:urease accessory protein